MIIDAWDSRVYLQREVSPLGRNADTTLQTTVSSFSLKPSTRLGGKIGRTRRSSRDITVDGEVYDWSMRSDLRLSRFHTILLYSLLGNPDYAGDQAGSLYIFREDKNHDPFTRKLIVENMGAAESIILEGCVVESMSLRIEARRIASIVFKGLALKARQGSYLGPPVEVSTRSRFSGTDFDAHWTTTDFGDPLGDDKMPGVRSIDILIDSEITPVGYSPLTGRYSKIVRHSTEWQIGVKGHARDTQIESLLSQGAKGAVLVTGGLLNSTDYLDVMMPRAVLTVGELPVHSSGDINFDMNFNSIEQAASNPENMLRIIRQGGEIDGGLEGEDLTTFGTQDSGNTGDRGLYLEPAADYPPET